MEKPTENSEARSSFAASWREWDWERIAVWALVLSGIALRLWYLWDFSGSPLFDRAIGADAGEYYRRASQLTRGVAFPVSPDIHAPLYSCFLALLMKLGADVPTARVVQVVLNYGAWLAFYWLLRTGRTPLKVRLVFLALAMLLPVPIFHQSELVSESLLIPLAAAFFWLRHFAAALPTPHRRAGALFGAGLVLGAMILTHPLTLLFGVAEVGWELFRRRYRNACLLAAALAVTVGGFCAAQSVYYRKLCGIQANTGFNLYLGNNPDATGGCYVRPGRRWRQVHRDAELEAKRRGISVDAVFLRKAGYFWLRRPFRALGLWAVKAFKVAAPRELPSGSDIPPLLCFTTSVFCGRMLTPALILFVAFGLWQLFRRRPKEDIHYLLLFLAMYLAQVVTVTSGRYRLLMLVPAALFAAEGLCAFDWRRLWLLPVLAIAGCGVFTVTDYGKMRAEAALMYAEALLDRGDGRTAGELAAYALGRPDDPDPAHAWELRGGAAQQLSREAKFESDRFAAVHDDARAAEFRREAQREIDFAGECYLKMVEIEPTFHRGWMHLAILAESAAEAEPKGGWNDKAEKWYRRALKLAPRAPDLCYNYAEFRFRTRRPCAEAVQNAIAAAPDWFRPWHLAGIVAMTDGNYRRAAECFARAMELSPNEAVREVNLSNLRHAEERQKNVK